MCKGNLGPKTSNIWINTCSKKLNLRFATRGHPHFCKPNCSLYGNSTLIFFWETTPPTLLSTLVQTG